MLGNFGLKLQNSPKLPHIHARFHCNASEQCEMGYCDSLVLFPRFASATCNSNFNWFTRLSVSSVIGSSDYFGFSFTTLD